jgi:hypothetical protein
MLFLISLFWVPYSLKLNYARLKRAETATLPSSRHHRLHKTFTAILAEMSTNLHFRTRAVLLIDLDSHDEAALVLWCVDDLGLDNKTELWKELLQVRVTISADLALCRAFAVTTIALASLAVSIVYGINDIHAADHTTKGLEVLIQILVVYQIDEQLTCPCVLVYTKQIKTFI